MLTWIELNTRAFTANIAALKKRIGQNVALMPVIKSNAYGHGLLEIARCCEQERAVSRLCVAGLDEALTLVRAGIRKSCIVLSFFDLDRVSVGEALDSGLISFPVYTIQQARFLNAEAKKRSKQVKIHIKIDTGTSRVGIDPREALNFFKTLKKLSFIDIEGVFSHFSSSEESRAITNDQENIFNQTVEALRLAGCVPPIRHIACSASTLLYPRTHENAVRPGVSVYGIYPSPITKKTVQLKPVLSFFTKIVHLKTAEKGTGIGYGRTYIMPKKGVIATLPIGYFDGFDRRFSNKGYVLIKGVKCPVRGRVCMNLTMVEIPYRIARQVKMGDTVTLIGKQKNASISADDWARSLDTISYEALARLGSHIPRIITSS